jgi:Na+-transporting methylmalonyl-CoA/oxaloacetate decarboxylase gamma subunit
MNGVIVLFAVLATFLIAISVIGALRRRRANEEAACGAQDESVLLI